MKRQKKRFVAVLLALLMVLAAGACGKNENENPNGSGENDSQNEAVKSDGYAKFSQLKIGMTESEVNAILGEPVRVDKAYYYYSITVNGQDMEIEVWISMVSDEVIYFNGDFYKSEYRSEFADRRTDLSAAGKLDSGELSTYEECVSAFKTSGYLITEDDKGEKRYLWVDIFDGELCVTFRADGSVKSYSGYC